MKLVHIYAIMQSYNLYLLSKGEKDAGIVHRLNCKINSTNGGTFSKSAGNFFWVFFWSRGPNYVQIGPGIQNFKKYHQRWR